MKKKEAGERIKSVTGKLLEKSAESAAAATRTTQKFLADTRPQRAAAAKKAKDWAKKASRSVSEIISRETPVEDSFKELAEAAGALHDACLREKKGRSLEQAASIAARVGGGTAFTGALLSAAALFGTASTGTAIGTLSGAAFTSAALAWLGGSVAVGTAVITGGAILAGLGTTYALRKWISTNIFAPARQDAEIGEDEKPYIQALQHLVITLQALKDEDVKQPDMLIRLCWSEILNPAIKFFDHKLYGAYSSWPAGSRRQLEVAIKNLKSIRGRQEMRARGAVPIGIVAVVALKLLGDTTEFTEEQELVLEAMRRSTTALTNATPEEIGDYLEKFTPAQLSGFHNNVKGIYHEIAYENAENSDGDQYLARLFPETNHAGGDVEIIDADTGDVVEVIQLKATDNVQAVAEHMAKYQEIGIMVTNELAAAKDLPSSGFDNEDIDEIVRGVIDEIPGQGTLSDLLGTSIQGGMTGAAVALLLSLGIRLRRGAKIEDAGLGGLSDAKRGLIGGAVAAVVTELLI